MKEKARMIQMCSGLADQLLRKIQVLEVVMSALFFYKNDTLY